MPALVSLCLAALAVVHLLPLVGVRGTRSLTSLYGVTADDPNLAILLRHRAVLFAVIHRPSADECMDCSHPEGVRIGVFSGFAALPAQRSEVVWAALAGNATSLFSFLVIAGAVGGYNAQIARVVRVDRVAAVVVAVSVCAHALSLRSSA